MKHALTCAMMVSQDIVEGRKVSSRTLYLVPHVLPIFSLSIAPHSYNRTHLSCTEQISCSQMTSNHGWYVNTLHNPSPLKHIIQKPFSNSVASFHFPISVVLSYGDGHGTYVASWGYYREFFLLLNMPYFGNIEGPHELLVLQ